MPTEVDAVLEAVQELKTSQNALETRMNELGKGVEDARKSFLGGVPNVRTGEDPLTSRGYSVVKALGVMARQIEPDQAKVECQVAEKLRKYHNQSGFKKTLTDSVFIPFWSQALTGDADLAHEVHGLVKAGYSGWDPQEFAHIRQKMAMGGYTKALSWTDETAGGAVVAPPAFGEFIEVLRNNEVLMAAGARTIPMPPQGRITMPRQTSAMTAYHVGESTLLTSSDLGTGDVTLQAKKLTILAKLPNELFHFAGVPIEGLVREDMMKVISLKMDKTLLEDVGSATTPKGLINYSNINTHTSHDPGTVTDGYRIQPRDPYSMVAKVEEQNAIFKAFIMRPLLWSTIVTRRADAVSAGDEKGPFAFNVWREVGADLSVDRLRVGNLCGYPVYKSTQLSITRSKGSSTNLTYVLGGDFADYLIALGGALEFQVTTQGDTPFTYDQTWFKGVMYYDGAPRHEASFILMDQMYQST